MNKSLIKLVLIILCLYLRALVFPQRVSATATSPNYSLEGESFNEGVETDAASTNYSTHSEIGQPGGNSQSSGYNLNEGLLFIAVQASSPTPTPGASPSPSTSSNSSSTSTTTSPAGNSIDPIVPVADELATEKAEKKVTNFNTTTEPIIKKSALEESINTLKPQDKNDLASFVILSLLLLFLLWFLLLLIKKRRQRSLNTNAINDIRSLA